MHLHSIKVAVRSNAQDLKCLIGGITGLNLAEGMDVRLLCLLSLAGSGFCDELITRSRESYRLCVCVWSRNLKNEWGCCATENKQINK